MSAQVINSQPLEIQPDRQAGVRDYGRDAVMDMVYFTARNNYERQVMRHLAETRQDIPFELDVRPPLLGRMTGCSCSARSSSKPWSSPGSGCTPVRVSGGGDSDEGALVRTNSRA